MAPRWVFLSFFLLVSFTSIFAFQTDELTEDDDEWGIVGAGSKAAGAYEKPMRVEPALVKSTRSAGIGVSADRKVQFVLEHSFGGSDFVPAGMFTVRVRESGKGGQTLSKFRLSRNAFSSEEETKFQALLEADDFYHIRVPADVVSTGDSYAVSSVKARCLAASNFQERFDFHMDQGHVVGVTFGGAVSCPYPRLLQTPLEWTFNSLIIVKNAEQASRPSSLPEITILPEDEILAEDGTIVKKLPEKTFWQKYWMYIIPIGLIVLNAISQVANMPEEGAAPAASTVSGPRRR